VSLGPSCSLGLALTPSAHRALQNPNIFTSEHYKQAAYAVAGGIAIRILIAVPVRLSPFAPMTPRN
jgi:hypothetical protein